jgi:oxygen-independent coproporphyrinogen III oxidase
MNDSALFDAELIRRYDRNGPRYTSYPTAVQFHEAFDTAAYRSAALLSNAGHSGLSIYVHVPFCASPCFYCGCNRVITRDPLEGRRYVDALKREIGLQARLFQSHRTVEQLHFGGGTPTFLTLDQLAEVMVCLHREFALSNSIQREFSIEIDPRTVDDATIDGLAQVGFSRISLGVQDFDPQVQAAVNREQSLQQTLDVVAQARRSMIGSVSFDLIYGLPRQTVATFAQTLDQVVAARPDRVAVYGYAHMPQLFKAQRQIVAAELPSSAERLALLGLTISKLTEAGYIYIGMDHFALPGDGLAQALADGALQRNFQGYSSHAQCDLVGLGVSAIGKVGNAYAQNARYLSEYYAKVEKHQLAIERGVALVADDRVRADVIQRLMCDGVVDVARVERDHCIDFRSYFATELDALQPMLEDDLLSEVGSSITVSPRGRFLLRSIAMVFDAYLKQSRPPAFSE